MKLFAKWARVHYPQDEHRPVWWIDGGEVARDINVEPDHRKRPRYERKRCRRLYHPGEPEDCGWFARPDIAIVERLWMPETPQIALENGVRWFHLLAEGEEYSHQPDRDVWELIRADEVSGLLRTIPQADPYGDAFDEALHVREWSPARVRPVYGGLYAAAQELEEAPRPPEPGTPGAQLAEWLQRYHHWWHVERAHFLENTLQLEEPRRLPEDWESRKDDDDIPF